MSVVNAALFGAIMAVTVVGLDFYLYDKKNDALKETGGTPFASYYDNVKHRISSASEPAALEPAELATFLPLPPEGWTRAPYRPADGEVVTGRVYRQSMLSVDTTNDLLGKLKGRRKAAAFIVDTYAAGDERIIVQLSFKAPKRTKSLTEQIAAEVTQNIEAFGLGDDPVILGVVKGVVIRQWAQTNLDTQTRHETPVAYRRYKADIGGSVDIFVVTNANIASVQAVLGAIDMAGLAMKAGLPDAMVNNDRPIVWGEEAAPVAEAALAAAVVQKAEAEAAEPPPTSFVARKIREERNGVFAQKSSDRPRSATGSCVRRAGQLVCE